MPIASTAWPSPRPTFTGVLNSWYSNSNAFSLVMWLDVPESISHLPICWVSTKLTKAVITSMLSVSVRRVVLSCSLCFVHCFHITICTYPVRTVTAKMSCLTTKHFTLLILVSLCPPSSAEIGGLPYNEVLNDYNCVSSFCYSWMRACWTWLNWT